MPFCVNCGNQVQNTDKFCSRCGEKVLLPEGNDCAAPRNVSPQAASSTQESALSVAVIENQMLEDADISGFPDLSAEQQFRPADVETSAQPEPEASAQPPEDFRNFSPYARPQAGGDVPLQEPRYVPPVSPVPVYDPAAEEAVPLPPSVKVPLFPKKPLTIGRRLLAGLLCILLTLFSFSGLILGIARTATSPEGLEKMVENLELSDIAAYPFILDAQPGESLTHWLQDALAEKNDVWASLSHREFEKYLGEEIKPFISDKLGEFARCFHSGNGTASVTEKEMTRMLEKSGDYLEEKYGLQISQQHWQQIANWIGTFGLYELADMELLTGFFGGWITLARFADSWVAVGLLGILSLLCIFLLAKTTHSSIRTLGNTGTALTLAGLIPGAALALATLSPQIWNDLLGQIELLSAVSGSVLNLGRMGILTVFGGGILLLVIRWVLLAVRVKRKPE